MKLHTSTSISQMNRNLLTVLIQVIWETDAKTIEYEIILLGGTPVRENGGRAKQGGERDVRPWSKYDPKWKTERKRQVSNVPKVTQLGVEPILVPRKPGFRSNLLTTYII